MSSLTDDPSTAGACALAIPVEQDTLEDPPLRRHKELWFSDGSVVIRAQDWLFRVHMSQLSRRSILFRDMFTLPQTAVAPSQPPGPILEGCPVIELYDPAEDVTNLLTALYDGTNFGSNDPEDFRVVSGLIRLSTKYLIDHLLRKALEHLAKAWPSTLRGWDAREDVARAFEAEHPSSRANRFPSPIDVINLAREIDAPSLLPAAFYDLSRYHFSQIFEPTPDDPLALSVSTLSPFDMQCLSLGKEASQCAIIALIRAMGTAGWSSQPDLNSAHCRGASHRRRSSGRVCVSPAACQKDLSELVDLATQHYLFDREHGCTDPLYVAEELGQLKSADFSECKACAKELEQWAFKERERLWKSIPGWFRLNV